MYTDEGITGTSTKHRDGFNQMIADALAGKIDLIVTKSVSRFARNTVDTLTTIRHLKEHGVEVFFEKENLYTMDSKGELLITIMSSLAQEESRSISENTTWGQRKRFADGKVSMAYKQFLGYRRGPDGTPEVVPEEADVILRIYRLFLAGQTPHGICRTLEANGVLTPCGKTKWSPTTVLSILTNEKYKGDALLQKSFCTDFLTKKMKINEGEVPQYYVENSHPAIVTKEMFDQVQQELTRRKALGRHHRGTSCFASKLVCECCGEFFGCKTWHSTDIYRKTVLRCNHKYKGAEKCATPHFSEAEIGMRFVEAYNLLLQDRDFILEDGEELISRLTDTTEYERELEEVESEKDLLLGMLEQAVSQNATQPLDQEEYHERFKGLAERYERARDTHIRLKEKISLLLAKRDSLHHFFDQLRTSDILVEFDPVVWQATVDHVTVHVGGSTTFCFKNGIEITI